MSVERLEVAASSLSFVINTFPFLSIGKKKKKKEGEINIYNYKNWEEK
jgi:hypothetical protein